LEFEFLIEEGVKSFPAISQINAKMEITNRVSVRYERNYKEILMQQNTVSQKT